mmetsp:Transcript_29007/g.66652  ORF Transcript_29007/g.66652 Transcript_29007/m.66652 type:complete len:324 (+) Transcript_29007:68-1039(+)
MSSLKDVALGGLTAVAGLWGASSVLQLHTEIRRRQAQYEQYPKYQDLLLTLLACVVFVAVQLLFRFCFGDIARSVMPKKSRWSMLVWDVKVVRCCDSAFKCTFYLTSTVLGYLALRQESWMPWPLGGSGSTAHCWTDGYPAQAMPQPLKLYYLITLGFQLSEVVLLFSETRHPDFLEMLLHHIVTCFMVGFSYLLNYVRIGSLVMLLHGATDIFIYASKTFVDTSFKRLSIVSYVALVLAYAWFRIYVFPVHVMRSAWLESVAEAGTSLHAWGFFNFALWVLLLLHMYWFGLVLKIGMQFQRTGEARDLQSNLSRMELHKKKS